MVEDWRQKDQLESGTVIQGEIKALGKKKKKREDEEKLVVKKEMATRYGN